MRTFLNDTAYMHLSVDKSAFLHPLPINDLRLLPCDDCPPSLSFRQAMSLKALHLEKPLNRPTNEDFFKRYEQQTLSGNKFAF